MFKTVFSVGLILKGRLAGCKSLGGEGNGTPLSPLAWKIPWMEEPGGLQSTGRRVGHD